MFFNSIQRYNIQPKKSIENIEKSGKAQEKLVPNLRTFVHNMVAIGPQHYGHLSKTPYPYNKSHQSMILKRTFEEKTAFFQKKYHH